MARLIRIGGSFAIVLVAYWAYALVAVPLIEPSAHRRAAPDSEAFPASAAGRSKERWGRELRGLFPPGSWELENPTILEMDRVKLLMKGYERLESGKRVSIRPCTMIFTPDRAAETPEEHWRRSIVLEAPEGAILEFDRPFELRKIEFGQLEKGRLDGRIRIRSAGKSPGPEDDLEVIAHDVDLTEKRVSTDGDVDFRLGPNHGRGRKLRIHLYADPDREPDRHGPNIDGVESAEIVHLDYLRLHLEDPDALVPGLPRDGKPPGRSEAPKEAEDPAPAQALPIEVRCRGPFRFDPLGQVATFEDRVDVERVHPEGPVDQLNCEKLSIHFAQARKALPHEEERTADRREPPSPADRSRQFELQPRRITAEGAPVVVRAPSERIEARGEWLDYDFHTGWITLDGPDEVYLQQGTNEIRAPKLRYQLAEEGRLGRATAEGAGWLRAATDEKPDQQLTARWTKRLQLRPHEGQPVVSLYGDAQLKFGELGQMDATEIHFYVFERPPSDPKDRVEIRPDRLVALGKVSVDSPQVSGTVDQLGVWFEEKKQTDASAEHADASPDRRATPSDRAQDPREGPGGAPASEGSAAATDRDSAATDDDRHFKIDGRLLQARVLVPPDLGSSKSPRGAEAELAELIIEGGVDLTETRTARPDDLPVTVSGELVHVEEAGEPHRTVLIRGNPARFQGRGLTLSGTARDSCIELDGGTNELRVDEPGWTELPLDHDLEGRPLATPGRLQVQWKRRMVFDGARVRFEGAVVAAGRHQRGQSNLHTEVLDVHLARTIRFAEVKERPERVELRSIVCHGGALMENRSLDEEGRASFDRFEVPKPSIDRNRGSSLSVDRVTGEIRAGPGTVTTVRRASSDLLPALGGQRTTAAYRSRPDASDASDAAEDDEDDAPLRYLNVRYEGSLEGNLHQRQMTFLHDVRTAYAPVDSWGVTIDPNDFASLGPRGVLLSCRELTVTEMPLPTGEGRATEMVARGNVEVEGRTFSARAPRMTYDDVKQLLILEGNGWAHAELYHQKQVGAPWSEVEAGRVLYWISTGQAHLERARSLKTQ